MKNKLVLACVVASAFAGAPAVAQRLPAPRPPSVFVPFFTWTGAYTGFNLGYGLGTSTWGTPSTGATTGHFRAQGMQVGGTLGYNYETAGFVVGLETDLDWSGIKGSTNHPTCASFCETKNTWLGTLRGRLGYALDRYMPYVTGGMAYGGIQTANSLSATTRSKIGYTLGTGSEYYFMHNWSAKIEYLYVDLGHVTCNTSCTGGGAERDVKLNMHVVRTGVNFKF